MKCREKLKLEHPEKISDGFCGGCFSCPHAYGYLDKPNFCEPGYAIPERCTRCWDREIPEPEDTPAGTIIWKDGHTENILEYVKHTDSWIVFHAMSGYYLYKRENGFEHHFYKQVEMDEFLPVDIKSIDLREEDSITSIGSIIKPSTEIDIHKLIDECIEKKDRYITIFTSKIGTSVNIYPMPDEGEENGDD